LLLQDGEEVELGQRQPVVGEEPVGGLREPLGHLHRRHHRPVAGEAERGPVAGLIAHRGDSIVARTVGPCPSTGRRLRTINTSQPAAAPAKRCLRVWPLTFPPVRRKIGASSSSQTLATPYHPTAMP